MLQLKLGTIRPQYFKDKYAVDILDRFGDQFRSLADEGYVTHAAADAVSLSRRGLLHVDVLLPRFFLPQHREIRYT